MDQAMVKRHLRQAEEHVLLGRQHIARQMEIVAELEPDGHDIVVARKLLETFQSMQIEHEAHRARIEKELSDLDEKDRKAREE